MKKQINDPKTKFIKDSDEETREYILQKNKNYASNVTKLENSTFVKNRFQA